MATTNGVIVNELKAPPTIAHHEGTPQGQAPVPLTTESIAAQRAKAGKLIAGTAAYSDSDMFKSPVCAFFIHLSFSTAERDIKSRNEIMCRGEGKTVKR